MAVNRSRQELIVYSYFVFGQNIWTGICQLVSILLISLLLYSHLSRQSAFRVRAMSQSMHLYLGSELVMMIATIPYRCYLVFAWAASKEVPPKHRPSLLFWSGVPNSCNYVMQLVPVTILTMDRCLALSMVKSRRRILRLSSMAIPVLYGLYLLSFAGHLPLDERRVKGCLYYSCMNTPIRNILMIVLKTCIGTVNLLFALAFFMLLKRRRQPLNNVRNRTVRFAVVMEILMNLLPNISSVIFYFITGVQPGEYLAEYGTMLTVTDLAICSVYYSFLLLTRRKKSGGGHDQRKSQGQISVRELASSNENNGVNDVFL